MTLKEDALAAIEVARTKVQAMPEVAPAPPPSPPPGPEPTDEWDPPATAVALDPSDGSTIPGGKPYILPGKVMKKVRLAPDAQVWVRPGGVFDGTGLGQDLTAGNATIIALEDRVTIKGYGQPDRPKAPSGASVGNATSRLRLHRLLITLCEGAGFAVGPNSRVDDVESSLNTRYGMKGFGSGSLLTFVNLHHNNTAKYNEGDEGGCKMLWSNSDLNDLESWENEGAGFWNDGAGNGVRVRRANIHDNTGHGVHHELSGHGDYMDCKIQRNGKTAIFIASASATITGGNMEGSITGEDNSRAQLGVIEVLKVVVRLRPNDTSWGMGLRPKAGMDPATYKLAHRWAGNRYEVPDLAGKYFRMVRNGVDTGLVTFPTWKGYGPNHDADSQLVKV